MTETGDPYEGVDPRLAWMLRVLSGEFGMLGVMEAQQAAYYYANTKGRIDHRIGPESDESPPEVRVSPHADRETATAWSAAFGPTPEPGRRNCTSCGTSARDCEGNATWGDHRACCDYCERAYLVGRHESDGDVLARLGTDARKWAEEFVRSVDARDDDFDVDQVAGWFASAIGAGESKHAVELDYLAYLVGRHYPEKARDWFNNYYGSDEFKAPGPDGFLGDLQAERESEEPIESAPDAREFELDGEFLDRVGTDAARWAEEFIKRFRGRTVVDAKDLTYGTPDMWDEGVVCEPVMTAWFADAIEAGRPAGVRIEISDKDRENLQALFSTAWRVRESEEPQTSWVVAEVARALRELASGVDPVRLLLGIGEDLFRDLGDK